MNLVCCFLTIAGFSEEEEDKFSLENISIASVDKVSSVASFFFKGGTVTIESTSTNSSREWIVYPIEESNFAEIFGRKP